VNAPTATGRAERALLWLVRVEAVVLLAAVPAVVLPTSWMATVHDAVGLGELPRAPIVEYLTRSASWVYASWGFFYAYAGFDVRPYLRLLRYLAVTKALFGLGVLALDGWVGMPTVWTAVEGPGIFAVALAQYVLAARALSQVEASG
jgi:hypothetical protein